MTAIDNNLNEADKRKKVLVMIKAIQVATFVTMDEDGLLRSRPMAPLHFGENGEIWFFTNVKSGKVDEIEGTPEVLLSLSNPETMDYVSLNGRAEIVRDKVKAAELWSEVARLWFPAGPSDPDLVCVRFQADSAEYWDSPSATMMIAYGYLKARLTGQAANLGEQVKVRF